MNVTELLFHQMLNIGSEPSCLHGKERTYIQHLVEPVTAHAEAEKGEGE